MRTDALEIPPGFLLPDGTPAASPDGLSLPQSPEGDSQATSALSSVRPLWDARSVGITPADEDSAEGGSRWSSLPLTTSGVRFLRRLSSKASRWQTGTSGPLI